jgi:hypothetical protein
MCVSGWGRRSSLMPTRCNVLVAGGATVPMGRKRRLDGKTGDVIAIPMAEVIADAHEVRYPSPGAASTTIARKRKMKGTTMDAIHMAEVNRDGREEQIILFYYRKHDLAYKNHKLDSTHKT